MTISRSLNNPAELEKAIEKLIAKMQEEGLLDPDMAPQQKNQIKELVLEGIEAAQNKNDGLKITNDFFENKDTRKKVMALVITASLQTHFNNDKNCSPALKNTFNTVALATLLFNSSENEEKKAQALKATFSLAAKFSLLLKPTQNNLSKKEENIDKKTPKQEAEDLLQQAIEYLFAALYGQTKDGQIFAGSSLPTNSAGIVKISGDQGPGLGGLLEEIEKIIDRSDDKIDHAFKEIHNKIDNTAETIEPSELFSTAPTPKLYG